MSQPGRSNPPSLKTRLVWMEKGTRLFADQLAHLADAELTAPSRLPGWTRAHVVGHVARNADALRNLLHWARTGRETPMYPSAGDRDRGIQDSAAQAPAELRVDLDQACRRLAEAARDLPEDAWAARVRSAQGRDIPASEVPWMRTREVWVHAVDLDAGVGFTAFPPELVDALLDDTAYFLTRRPGCPAVLVAPEDRDRTWTLGDVQTSGAPPTRVSGPATGLLAWLTGRAAPEHAGVRTPDAASGQVPDLPRWL